MDILIKRKNYKEALDFLNEKSNELDWNLFTEAIRTNKDFLEYFKVFLVNLNCVLRLKTFLLKIFCTNKDKYFQEIVYDIIKHLTISQSEFSSHFLIQNLLLVQTVKLVVLDKDNRTRLQDIIQTRSIKDHWFIELLHSFEFWAELGLLYELGEEYTKSLEFYEKTDTNGEKIRELNQIIRSRVSGKIEEFEEENYHDSERIEKNMNRNDEMKEECEN